MTETERMRERNDNLRSSGLRPVRVWLPDTRTEAFAAECARQSRLIREAEASSTTADDDEAWFAASDRTGWTA